MHVHTVACYASNAAGPLAYTPCRADGLDRNLRNMKEVDFRSLQRTYEVVPGLTLVCEIARKEQLMLDKLTEAKMAREHYEKYEALAQEFKRFEIEKLVPASKDRILMALEAGDVHLNSIPLNVWDAAALVEWNATPMVKKQEFCPHCHQRMPAKTLVVPDLWKNFYRLNKVGGKVYFSLAERVCLLKHVAKYWIGGAKPPEKVEEV